jgi:hypothetical protein
MSSLLRVVEVGVSPVLVLARFVGRDEGGIVGESRVVCWVISDQGEDAGGEAG